MAELRFRDASRYACGMSAQVKSREARLRRAADRQGMTLHRSRRRDPHALTYGRYWLIALDGRVIGADPGRLVGDPPGLTMDEVEAILTGTRT